MQGIDFRVRDVARDFVHHLIIFALDFLKNQGQAGFPLPYTFGRLFINQHSSQDNGFEHLQGVRKGRCN